VGTRAAGAPRGPALLPRPPAAAGSRGPWRRVRVRRRRRRRGRAGAPAAHAPGAARPGPAGTACVGATRLLRPCCLDPGERRAEGRSRAGANGLPYSHLMRGAGARDAAARAGARPGRRHQQQRRRGRPARAPGRRRAQVAVPRRQLRQEEAQVARADQGARAARALRTRPEMRTRGTVLWLSRPCAPPSCRAGS